MEQFSEFRITTGIIFLYMKSGKHLVRPFYSKILKCLVSQMSVKMYWLKNLA